MEGFTHSVMGSPWAGRPFGDHLLQHLLESIDALDAVESTIDGEVSHVGLVAAQHLAAAHRRDPCIQQCNQLDALAEGRIDRHHAARHRIEEIKLCFAEGFGLREFFAREAAHELPGFVERSRQRRAVRGERRCRADEQKSSKNGE